MSALAEVVGAVDPAIARQAVDQTPPPHFEDWDGGATRAFTLEAVREGYLMHYGTPRAFQGLDPDLALLAGDALYALGLSRLADEGDLEAVAELSDLISLTARAHAEGRPELAENLWQASSGKLSAGDGPGARATWRDSA